MKWTIVFGAVAVSLIVAFSTVAAQAATTFTAKGEHVSLVLKESHDKGFASKDRLLKWLDDAYEAMSDLTGTTPDGTPYDGTPHDGAMIMIQEAPAPPQAEDAPEPIVVDTPSVAEFIAQANVNIMPFDLICALGRSFDGTLGKWTIWNDASADWQASWKLNYAYETMPDQTFKAAWPRSNTSPYQPRGAKWELVSGYQLMQSQYLFFGDAYLGDHGRTWDAMTGGELHSFFLRLQREYGWEPFKQLYRTYARFEALGYAPPETPEGKMVLLAALLQHQIDKDWHPSYLQAKALGKDTLVKPDNEKAFVANIVPAFERWRIPVTADKMADMYKRYPITDPDAAGPESPEAAAALLTVTIANEQPGGWMREGYGRLRFTFKNTGELPTKMVYWQARWMVDGKPFIHEWDEPDENGVYRGWFHDAPVYVPAGEEAALMKSGGLDPKLLDALGDATPLLKGTITFQTGGVEFVVPWEFEVPEAVMTEKLVRVEGKHMAYEITERHHEMLGENNARLIRWLDQAYEAMADLTGYTPYDGKIITIIESPDHPYYAYAGNPIIMDTTHMDKFVEAVNKQHMVFGWMHELGHDFDHADDGRHGKWYMWSYGASEAQANIKVVYTYEAMPDQDWKALLPQRESSAYMATVHDLPLDGKDCMDKQFIFNLDPYLADPTIPWTVRFCQHVFLQRIACVYGWDPVKKWYRTYKILADEGYERPETPEEKVKLMAAILCETTGVDLVPLFQLWKAPVTQADVDAMKEKYPIEDAVKSIVLPKPEER